MDGFFDYVNTISPISDKAFMALKPNLKFVELKKGEFFVKAGEIASTIGFLTNGLVRAFFLNQEGREYSKQFFMAPSIIGAYTSLLNKQPARIAQQALTDCEIVVLDYKKLEQAYENFHDLERLGRRVAESYFMEKEQKELEMALLDADKRYLILRERFPKIENLVPQYHIASYLGISPTQLSRIRRKLMHS
ncbi:Crp/Fnr family transcriptional regulator [Muricauda sp. DJ-13]|uniref:Crp/Fnr family transcriptional regulator n=1 Tax=Croceivirga thetidis TaxID=2721623 RepID=A0ABX1GPJ2_9FLAO|nr:Crp/Fnr family transcriptional regulator [Croceivirga thetidis]